MTSNENLVERFWRNVRKAPDNGCWIFGLGNNYGSLSIARGRAVRAHRFSWELHIGPIPEGMFVCHHCDNPPCVNPAHLFLGTVTDNNRDCNAKGRRPKMIPPPSYVNGSRHGESKLTEEQAAEIRKLAQVGISQRALARQFGIHQSNIWRIIHRKAWFHVE